LPCTDLREYDASFEEGKKREYDASFEEWKNAKKNASMCTHQHQDATMLMREKTSDIGWKIAYF
jgi:hypothetical protein